MRHVSWTVTLPLTVAVVVFALANRGDVTINLWPLPWTVDLPVFLVVLGCLLAGFLAGGAVMWLSAGPRRREGRRAAHEAGRLSRELEDVKRRLARTAESAAPADGAGDPV